MASKIAIAVAKGDGIGPEIMDATLHILKAAKLPLEYKFVEMGNDYYKKGFSTGMTPEAKETVESTRILLKGPMETPKGLGVKSINVTSRKVWSTFANKRVFRTLPGVETVFSKAGINIDLTLFRENIEDTYGGIEHFQTTDVAQCRRLITRVGSEQIHRAAFEMAKLKDTTRVTCCHKANIMKLTDGLFLETFYKVAKEYPGVKADDAIVDDLAMKLVTRPDKYNVLVLPNLQGDIMSDLCAGLVGGLGMAPSANIGDQISIFEAVHGTAPDIAGKGYANPTALLMSTIMMLRHLGLHESSNHIDKALRKTLADGVRTRDLVQLPGYHPASTHDFAEAIVKNLPAEAKSDVVTVNWDHLSFLKSAKPAVNQMMIGETETSKKTVGTDIFVDSPLLPKDIATIINKELESTNLKLVMISNRGTQIWPTGSVYTQLVNHHRCRIELKDSKESIHESDLLIVVAKIAKHVRVCSTEMLLVVNDQRKFTLAQGQ
ncbi:hypothetical protein BC833DRAFT_585939 [Globomyces pollinis-pini]|nr:hypothetical protein BC833DRAFT_585939 [Globomyces pollinis-pini]KAJ2998417.1 hypothetical protein HDV02_004532 [Globomyces sp. JEL0801]